MNADVHEGSELRNVGDHTLQHHAGFHVKEFANLLVEAGRDELVRAGGALVSVTLPGFRSVYTSRPTVGCGPPFREAPGS